MREPFRFVRKHRVTILCMAIGWFVGGWDFWVERYLAVLGIVLLPFAVWLEYRTEAK